MFRPSCAAYEAQLPYFQALLEHWDERLISIGGDHTIALPMLRALNKVHGPVALLHFDAHLDTWDTCFNQPVTHGTIIRRAFVEGLLIEDKTMHGGIRGPVYDRKDFLRSHDRTSGLKSPSVLAEFAGAAVLERSLFCHVRC